MTRSAFNSTDQALPNAPENGMMGTRGVSTGAEGQVLLYDALPSALAKVCTWEENRCGMLGTSWDFLANDPKRRLSDDERAFSLVGA